MSLQVESELDSMQTVDELQTTLASERKQHKRALQRIDSYKRELHALQIDNKVLFDELEKVRDLLARKSFEHDKVKEKADDLRNELSEVKGAVVPSKSTHKRGREVLYKGDPETKVWANGDDQSESSQSESSQSESSQSENRKTEQTESEIISEATFGRKRSVDAAAVKNFAVKAHQFEPMQGTDEDEMPERAESGGTFESQRFKRFKGKRTSDEKRSAKVQNDEKHADNKSYEDVAESRRKTNTRGAVAATFHQDEQDLPDMGIMPPLPVNQSLPPATTLTELQQYLDAQNAHAHALLGRGIGIQGSHYAGFGTSAFQRLQSALEQEKTTLLTQQLAQQQLLAGHPLTSQSLLGTTLNSEIGGGLTGLDNVQNLLVLPQRQLGMQHMSDVTSILKAAKDGQKLPKAKDSLSRPSATSSKTFGLGLARAGNLRNRSSTPSSSNDRASVPPTSNRSDNQKKKSEYSRDHEKKPCPVNHDSFLKAVKNPKESDVLCGRGRGNVANPGNLYYKRVIELNCGRYKASTLYSEKIGITQDVVNHINQNGRFLKFDNEVGGWVEIDFEESRKKVGLDIRNFMRPMSTSERRLLHNTNTP